MVKKNKKLGEFLLAAGQLDPPQLKQALLLQAKTNELLGKILEKLGFVSEDQVAEALSKQLAIPFVNPHELVTTPDILKLIPLDTAEKRVVFPLALKDKKLTLAMANPFDFRIADEISFITGAKVVPVLATESAIRTALEKNWSASPALVEMIKNIPASGENPDFLDCLNWEADFVPLNKEANPKVDEAPMIVRLVTMIMVDAAKSRASDVHIEPSETEVSVRYRIDGVLKTMVRYPLHIHDSVVSRIKVVSALDITNRRLPQDGRTLLRVDGKEINIRLSTLPSVNGEKVVLRLLDDEVGLLPMGKLGLPASILDQLISILNQPQGMILITGPTGSGKTTTLYALLHQIQSETKNIITIEDPVEYRVPGTTQIGINPAVGLTFPAILRHILRQDPDTIMIGEIRDFDTAEIATQAALTGHLVLSTLHTNNTVASITRLIDLGLPPNLVASSVTAILAQRLIRQICPACKAEVEPPAAVGNLAVPPVAKYYKGRGCKECKHTGYKGRVGAYEFLRMNPEFKKLIFQQASEAELLEAARDQGMRSLFEDAWIKVGEGRTTAEEVLSKVPQ